MSAVPEPRPARVSVRPRHVGALFAALAYAAAGFVVYQIVTPALGNEGPRAADRDTVVAAPPAGADLSSAAPETLTLRAIASRAQRSAYVVRFGGGPRGSALVAWVHQGKISFLLTARAAVAPTLAQGGTLQLRRGGKSWPARVVSADRGTGLALIRVNAALERPLWPNARERVPLKPGATALVAPAGKKATFVRGEVTRDGKGFALTTAGGRATLGAPVVTQDGRLAAIVTALPTSGQSRLTPIRRACKLRGC